MRRENYTKVSFLQLKSALKWAQNQLNLRDWEISLEYGIDRPYWVDPIKKVYGGIINLVYVGSFYAEIWINPKDCEMNVSHPISVLMHEMVHLLLESYNQKVELLHPNERLVNTLEYHLFRSWLLRKGKN
jgi:hypothetical protein